MPLSMFQKNSTKIKQALFNRMQRNRKKQMVQHETQIDRYGCEAHRGCLSLLAQVS